MKRWLWALLICAASACTAAINTAELARVKALPTPLSSRDECLYVSCTNAVTAPLTWPVMKFASRVREEFEAGFGPIGSRDFPLAIILGSETQEVTTLQCKQRRLGLDYLEYCVTVPNPNTVDLELLRRATIEGLLQGKAHQINGASRGFSWPGWFVQAMVDTSLNLEWRSAAYESFYEAGEVGTLPALMDYFKPNAKPAREVAVFFALWLKQWAMRSNGGMTQEKFIVAPWEAKVLLGEDEQAAQKAWAKFQTELASMIFVPGELTLPQLVRWHKTMEPATDAKSAKVRIERALISAAGRPPELNALVQLYVAWYLSVAKGESPDAVAQHLAKAEAAYQSLEKRLQRQGPLVMEVKEQTHE